MLERIYIDGRESWLSTNRLPDRGVFSLRMPFMLLETRRQRSSYELLQLHGGGKTAASLKLSWKGRTEKSPVVD